MLGHVNVPSLDLTADRVSWSGLNGLSEGYYASEIWKTLYGNHPEVGWHKAIWFSGAIPKYAYVCGKRVTFSCLSKTGFRFGSMHEPLDIRDVCYVVRVQTRTTTSLFGCVFPLQV